MRFPEFEGEWKGTTLGGIGEVVGGGTPNTKIAKYWNGCIHWFTPSEIKSNYVSKSERTISELGLSKSSAKLLPIGSILITTRATIGEVAITTEECTTNQGFQSLIVDKDTDNVFIANWIRHNKGELIRRAKGSTFAEISKSEIERIPIMVPSNPDEQIKIANLLRHIDNRIATQSQIIKELETLISRFCRTYHNSVVKEEYSIADLGDPFRAMALSKENLSTEGKKCILYGELFTKYDCVIDDIASRTENSSSTQTLSGDNDLLFPASTTVDAVSLISPSAISIKNVILGGDLFGIRLYPKFNNEYVSYAINHIYKRKLAKYAQGSTIVHLYYSDIKDVKLELPDFDAQNFFANMMRLLRGKIRNEHNLLFEYKKQKKYLLNQMFI